MAERYTRAIGSSNLVLREAPGGDVDVLIAAGWAREGLGASLYRLRSEFDSVRADHQRAQQDLRLGLGTAHVLSKKPATADEAVALAKSTRAEALTARCLILIHLKSLAGVVSTLGKYAQEQSDGMRTGLRPEAVARTCGVVLDVFLDSSCSYCSGLGFTGAYAGPQFPCRPCKQSGRRDIYLDSSNAREDQFGKWLLCELEAKIAVVEQSMARFLSRRDKPHRQPAELRA